MLAQLTHRHAPAPPPPPSPLDSVNRIIGFMVGRLEGAFRELMEDDLTMYPPDKWKVRGGGLGVCLGGGGVGLN